MVEWKTDIHTAESCQQLCLGYTGCSYALYSKPLTTCYFLAVPVRRCTKTIGPPHPNIDECKFDPTNKFFKIIIVGGHIESKRSDDVESLNPYNKASNCIKPQSYPEHIENLCGDKNIFCGGFNDNFEHSKRCFRINQDGSWIEISSLNKERQFAACTMLNDGSFWITGGSNSNDLDIGTSTEILIDENSAFVESIPLPIPMDSHCISRINSSHLFMAGNRQSDSQDRAFIVNTQSDPFMVSELSRMHHKRSSAACGTINSDNQVHLIVAGGPRQASKTSEIYSFSTNSWKNGPELPRGFQYGGYVSDDNHSLLLISGIDEHGNIRDDIMQYNQTKNIFETLPGKIEKRRTYFTSSAIETDEDC